MNNVSEFDIVSIGGATQDIFVRTDLSKIMRLQDIFSKSEFLCYPYGSKLNIDEVFFGIGGGAVNTAINFSNLGFRSTALVKIGKDQSGDIILEKLNEKGVHTGLINRIDYSKSGFSVILNSFEGDRTVLAFRGANNYLSKNDIDWDLIKHAKWIYVSSLSGQSNEVLDYLSDFAEEHGVNMAFNPGNTQIKRGINSLKRILAETELLILNKEEASMLTGINENYAYINRDKCTGSKVCVDICPVDMYQIDEHGKAVSVLGRESCIKGCSMCVSHCPSRAISVAPWASNIDEQLIKLKSYGPKIVVITDGSKGVQIYDGKYRYMMASYDVPVKSTLGAGDAFASTFTAAMIETDWNIEESLRYATANSASCVQEYGAQTGLKTFEELQQFIESRKDDEEGNVSKQELEMVNIADPVQA